ncbi:MAG: hypothetical protein JNJ77_21465 [Planctomycetia bacterium]|nr:hypothetical protein [Planctomycetia bacterium]
MRRWLRCALMMSLLTGPIPILAQGQGQQKTCPTNASTSGSTTGSTASATGSANNQGMMNPQQIINQINRLEQLLLQLQSGQVTPPANSGISTVQAIQMIRQRITMLRTQLAQLQTSGNANSAIMSQSRPQQGAGFGKRK